MGAGVITEARFAGDTMSAKQHKSLMHSLGAFWGHLKHGATGRIDPASGAQRVEVRRETVERAAEPGEVPGAAAGSVTLRRTVIEEIEVRPGGGDGVDGAGRPAPER